MEKIISIFDFNIKLNENELEMSIESKTFR